MSKNNFHCIRLLFANHEKSWKERGTHVTFSTKCQYYVLIKLGVWQRTPFKDYNQDFNIIMRIII